MIKIFGDIFSGNCYKIKLAACLLGIGHEWVHVDILQGESRTPEFLRLNPNGRIPVLVDDDRVLCESNAILNYLADGSPLLPADRWLRAEVVQWQFFEQYSHEPFIATSRYIVRYLSSPPERAGELAAKRVGGTAALAVMEQHLAGRTFFVSEALSIADISL
jgi:glutathione S-transferase